MKKETLCEAIANKKVVSFHYSLGKDPGTRFVEPHMIAYNSTEHLCLSAWFVSGHSASKEKEGFREYWLDGISNIQITNKTFTGPRDGYVPTGGKKYHNVQCAL